MQRVFCTAKVLVLRTDPPLPKTKNVDMIKPISMNLVNLEKATYTFLRLYEALQLAPHVYTAKEALEGCKLRTW